MYFFVNSPLKHVDGFVLHLCCRCGWGGVMNSHVAVVISRKCLLYFQPYRPSFSVFLLCEPAVA